MIFMSDEKCEVRRGQIACHSLTLVNGRAGTHALDSPAPKPMLPASQNQEEMEISTTQTLSFLGNTMKDSSASVEL